MSYISKRDARKNTLSLENSRPSQLQRKMLILESVQKYFSVPGRWDDVLPYIDEWEDALSLRDFEAFNVHVAPRINANYILEREYESGKKEKIHYVVYHKYKAELKGYNKICFDPFKRDVLFSFHYTTKNKEQKFAVTSICQLNYFMWLHRDKVLDYIKNNITKINSMIQQIEYEKEHMDKKEFDKHVRNSQKCLQQYKVNIQKQFITGGNYEIVR